ncbi:hypothetical protein LIER_43788 [Lithospermum erythrorhizon]|uniref:Uncharacterized protein n=1 Tax=Lithospermum erythrorhizon TaxID=34254 RepID=A0AAV3QVQ7_LITER
MVFSILYYCYGESSAAIGAIDDANGDEDEVILPSSSKGKGILVENDQLKANNGRSLTFDDDDDDEVQVSNLRREIYVGESSKSKHEIDNLLEKVGVDDAIGDLSFLW